MVTRMIERKVRIVAMQTRGTRILIQFSPLASTTSLSMEPQRMPRLEDIIVKEPETEEERIAMRIMRTYMNELQKVMTAYRPSLPSQRPPARAPFQLEVSAEDYEQLGKPTVNECLVLKLEYDKDD
jgi:hypothetical protein